MVIGHAEYHGLLTSMLYTFHMPVFFITAGYFFSRRNVDEPWDFCRKRFKGLYVPFVKWSLVWLVLHNVWHYFGILNEQYGNLQGGVTHPYTFTEAVKRVVMIFTSMSGYDEFMAGAFWFFRGLLVASILFLVLYKVLDSNTRLAHQWKVVLICCGAVAFTAAHIYFGFRLTTIPNGGWREVWGLFFFGVGVLYRQYEPKLREHWALALVWLLFIVWAGSMHFSGMNNVGRMRDLWTLPLTGFIGFLLVKYIAGVIDRRTDKLRRLMVFIGDNTLYVFVFHIISYKVVSLIKIWWYGLDFGQVGCHMVIHYRNDDDFWILYSIVGVALPLLVLKGVRMLSSKVRAIRSRE